MKNCQTCKFAAWQLSKSGSRMYGNWAECTYEAIAVIPASRLDVKKLLERGVAVRSHDSAPLECDDWEGR